MATGRISWAEAAPAGARGRISWASVDAEGAFGRISWVEVTEATVSVKGRISWAEASGGAAPPTIYTLTADPAAYVMSWAGSVSQVVLEADAGAYAVAGQDAALTLSAPSAFFVLVAEAGAYVMTGQDVGYAITPLAEVPMPLFPRRSASERQTRAPSRSNTQ